MNLQAENLRLAARVAELEDELAEWRRQDARGRRAVEEETRIALTRAWLSSADANPRAGRRVARVLLHLLDNAPRVIPREQIHRRFFGEDTYLKNIDAYICWTRAALRLRGFPGAIKNHRGVGFQVAPEAIEPLRALPFGRPAA